MTIRISNIIQDIDEDITLLKSQAAKKLGIEEASIEDMSIVRESIDARRKNTIKFNYTLDVSVPGEQSLIRSIKDKDVKLEDTYLEDTIIPGALQLKHRPVVVGLGPAGLFAALTLARRGYKPLVIERGEAVEERTKTVEAFWKAGVLNTESNVQFGEGGAGAFSDGKLTTRIKDRRCDYILKVMAASGAPKDILYKGKPHVGTDILKDVVKNIRQEIIALGGEVRFNSRLDNLVIHNDRLKAIIVNNEEIPCEALILAIGHSSRDTYEMLYNKLIPMEAKPFAIGVRAEHPQQLINLRQYGKYANHPRLGAADYRLAYNSTSLKRSVYSFCMCPGGVVVAAASEENRLVTNGMSYHARDKENANSAIVVSVSPQDFGQGSPLRGMEFQRKYESLAYSTAGGGYRAPMQLLGDFLRDRRSTGIKTVKPSYEPGYELRELKHCLPQYVTEALKEGFMDFDKKIKGFADNDVVLTGIETRTSAPLRILRNEGLESIAVEGLYPSGEGAGYAGGIISAAVDGMKVAEKIIEKYRAV